MMAEGTRMKLILFLLATSPLGGMALAQEEAASRKAGLESWGKIYEVLSHPRCANCHVGDDNRPRWSGPSYGLAQGEWVYHGMYVDGGVERDGSQTIPCTTCHSKENSDLPHGPPGAEVWALAPVEMEWFGKSADDICAQLKDPARNGDRTVQEVADHIAHDHLVHWGWDPGPGREPAPYSIEETARAVESWAAAGTPCPGDVAESAITAEE